MSKINYPVFKGMDIQTDEYHITIGMDGIFIAGFKDDCKDVEFSFDELYRIGQEKS